MSLKQESFGKVICRKRLGMEGYFTKWLKLLWPKFYLISFYLILYDLKYKIKISYIYFNKKYDLINSLREN